jgi:hypothetical protein
MLGNQKSNQQRLLAGRKIYCYSDSSLYLYFKPFMWNQVIEILFYWYHIRINSSIKVFEHHLKLKSKNALDVVRQYP